MADTPYPLGRLAHEDPRNAEYPMRAHLPPLEVRLPDAQYWTVPRVLNQGVTPSCVGHAKRHNLEATPVPVPASTGPDAMTIYNEAQKRDGIPLPHSGTTLIAAAKYLKEQGSFTTYVWAQTMLDIVQWVLLKGPVVIGSVWTNDMFTPDARGVLHPTGAVAGGHAWLVYGYHQPSGYFRMQNSWGAGWGQRGRAWIFYRDLESLVFQRGGECLAATEPLPAALQVVEEAPQPAKRRTRRKKAGEE